MNEILTITEIESRFDAEWVLVEDPQVDENDEVISGRVVWHSKDRDEVYDKLLELRPKHPAIVFTGKPAPDTAIVL
jgi:hypothetical protein